MIRRHFLRLLAGAAAMPFAPDPRAVAQHEFLSRGYQHLTAEPLEWGPGDTFTLEDVLKAEQTLCDAAIPAFEGYYTIFLPPLEVLHPTLRAWVEDYHRAEKAAAMRGPMVPDEDGVYRDVMFYTDADLPPLPWWREWIDRALEMKAREAKG